MKKKLFLIPTLITTFFVLLMVFCIMQCYPWRPPRIRCIDYLNTSFIYYKYFQYYKKHKIPYTQLREYVDIHFTGSHWQDEVKLQFAKLRVAEILEQRDTVHGVHFSFGDSATYEFVVKTQDLLIAARAQTWVNNCGEVWFVVMPEDAYPPESKSMEALVHPDRQ